MNVTLVETLVTLVPALTEKNKYPNIFQKQQAKLKTTL